MSNQNNSDQKKENPLLKGWNDFVFGIKQGFDTFQKTLEDQTKNSVENWEKSQKDVEAFFNNMGENFNSQIKKWNDDIQKIQVDNQQQWEAKTAEIKREVEKWQNQTRNDWKDGVKDWNRGMIKGAYVFMIVMIPMIIVLVLVIWVITQFLNLVPG